MISYLENIDLGTGIMQKVLILFKSAYQFEIVIDGNEVGVLCLINEAWKWENTSYDQDSAAIIGEVITVNASRFKF